MEKNLNILTKEGKVKLQEELKRLVESELFTIIWHSIWSGQSLTVISSTNIHALLPANICHSGRYFWLLANTRT